ncbi:MAG: conserved repeat family protein, partial [Nocardioides sp.]|nr:conserved repeat family protein [Nocardioides sp.]
MTATTEHATRGLFASGVHPVVEARTAELEAVLGQVSTFTDDQVTGRAADAARIEQLRLLEQIKAAAAGAQARVTVAFERSQLAQQDTAGVRAESRGRGIGDQVALARGSSTSQGPRHLGFAKALTQMPHTEALLAGGAISEWTATVLVRESAVLTLQDRRLVDERLCATTLDTATGELREAPVLAMTSPRVERAARALAAELDPAAVVRRNRRAENDRRVTIRPAPDTMTYLTGLLTVVQGVAAYA